MKWIVLGIAALMYALVIIMQDKKVLFSSLAALTIVGLAVLFPGDVFKLPQDLIVAENLNQNRLFALEHCIFDGIINWNVLLIYFGTMILASLFVYSRMPARIADSIVSKNSNTALAMTLVLALTGFISIFVENVATVLVMAPVVMALCQKMEKNPVPFIIALAVISNLEGTATLVGDPPSMIFASFTNYSFNDFFIHNGKLSIFFIIQAGLLVGCLFFYLIFLRMGKNDIQIEKEKIISWVPFVLIVLMIVGLSILPFIKIRFDYTSGCFVVGLGLFGFIWYLIKEKSFKSGGKFLRNLNWETIFFLIGIFIVVAAIQSVGLFDDLASILTKVTKGSTFLGFILILGISIVVSGFVDNIPYIMAMLPVADLMAKSLGLNGELYMFAILVGSCLGGNLTPFGASANVVAMGILKKENYKAGFGKWIKIGLPFTILTTVAAATVLWFVWK